MSMTDIKTDLDKIKAIQQDPSLAEWIGIHDALKDIRQEQIWVRDQIRELNLTFDRMTGLLQIIADREY